MKRLLSVAPLLLSLHFAGALELSISQGPANVCLSWVTTGTTTDCLQSSPDLQSWSDAGWEIGDGAPRAVAFTDAITGTLGFYRVLSLAQTVRVPLGVAAYADSPTSVTLEWVNQDDNGVLIQVSADGGATWSDAAFCDPGATTFTVEDLSPGTEYLFAISANFPAALNLSNAAKNPKRGGSRAVKKQATPLAFPVVLTEYSGLSDHKRDDSETTDELEARVNGEIPAFTNHFSQSEYICEFRLWHTEDYWFSLYKLQYKLRWNSGSTVVAYEQFIPLWDMEFTGRVWLEKMAKGQMETAVHAINPYTDTVMNPDHKDGMYEVWPLITTFEVFEDQGPSAHIGGGMSMLFGSSFLARVVVPTVAGVTDNAALKAGFDRDAQVIIGVYTTTGKYYEFSTPGHRPDLTYAMQMVPVCTGTQQGDGCYTLELNPDFPRVDFSPDEVAVIERVTCWWRFSDVLFFNIDNAEVTPGTERDIVMWNVFRVIGGVFEFVKAESFDKPHITGPKPVTIALAQPRFPDTANKSLNDQRSSTPILP